MLQLISFTEDTLQHGSCIF